MVGTIIPMVHGERLEGIHKGSLWCHGIGAIAASALFGATLGWTGGTLLRPSGPLTVAVLVVSGIGHLVMSQRDLGLCHFPMPQSHWQVPKRWLSVMPPRMAALVYGMCLGVGILTRISSSGFYVVLGWVVLSGEPMLGALIMGMFGFGRLIPLIFFMRLVPDPNEGARWLAILDRWRPAMLVVTGVFLAVSGGWLTAMALTNGLFWL